MQWNEFCDFHQKAAYHVSLDKYICIDLVKPKSPLFNQTPSKVRWTYFSYIIIIYLLRAMSIVALPMSYYYEMGDWWYGLFGWVISDYLYYELRNIISADLLDHALHDEAYYQSLKEFENRADKQLILIQKKSDMKALPLHKKIIEIFFK